MHRNNSRLHETWCKFKIPDSTEGQPCNVISLKMKFATKNYELLNLGFKSVLHRTSVSKILTVSCFITLWMTTEGDTRDTRCCFHQSNVMELEIRRRTLKFGSGFTFFRGGRGAVSSAYSGRRRGAEEWRHWWGWVNLTPNSAQLTSSSIASATSPREKWNGRTEFAGHFI